MYSEFYVKRQNNSNNRSQLGQVLLLNQVIDKVDLKYALKLQKHYFSEYRWKLIGEILVELDAITDIDLNTALNIQQHHSQTISCKDRLGIASSSIVKRSLDITGSVVMLCIAAPLFLLIPLAIYIESKGPVLLSRNRVGLAGKRFKTWKFRVTKPSIYLADTPAGKNFSINHSSQTIPKSGQTSFTHVGKALNRSRLDHLPLLLNILKGDMSFVGSYPRKLDDESFNLVPSKPGITGLWRVNLQVYSSKCRDLLECDRFYYNNWNYKLDIWIACRTILKFFTKFFRGVLTANVNHREYPEKVNFLNMAVENISMADLLLELKSGVVHTLNIDHLRKLKYDHAFLEAYRAAEYKVCDSQILVSISRFFGTPLKERISGSDFLPKFCSFHSHNQDVTIFLLGGLGHAADQAKHNINRQVGREVVIGAHSPSFGFERNQQECLNIIEKINVLKPTVLVVGVGAPKQEKWIYNYRSLLPSVKIFLAVGAAIDFEAGIQKRAPKWVSNLGFEWLYRLLCNPNRLWRRYLVDDLSCLTLIIRQKVGID
jgi:exopolysaccharide biosynthesis WecB/TagA/CpsF family protein